MRKMTLEQIRAKVEATRHFVEPAVARFRESLPKDGWNNERVTLRYNENGKLVRDDNDDLDLIDENKSNDE